MPTNYKSLAAASGLNDLFSKFGWRYTAYPEPHPGTVAIQYKSEALGMLRSVACDPLNLARWLQDHHLQPGARAEFERLLDRKPERSGAPVQQELNLGADSPLVRESMGD